MAEPKGMTEIEDVLSSIRRLVAADTRSGATASAPASGAAPAPAAPPADPADRLVLTPAQRIDAPAAGEAQAADSPDTLGAWDADSIAERAAPSDSDEDLERTLAELEAELDGDLLAADPGPLPADPDATDPAAEVGAEVALAPADDLGAADDGPAAEPAWDRAADPDGDTAAEPGAETAEDPAATPQTRKPRSGFIWEEGFEDLPETAEPAPVPDFPAEFAANPDDLPGSMDATDPVEAAEGPDLAAEPEDADETPDLGPEPGPDPGPEPGAEPELGPDLAADTDSMAGFAEAWEMAEEAEDQGANPEPEPEPEPDLAAAGDIGAWPDLATAAPVPPAMPVTAPAAATAPPATTGFDDDAAANDDDDGGADLFGAGLFGADDAAPLDEAALRDLVAEIIRDELRGALGARLGRNLRRLVREEIARELAARGLSDDL